MIKKKEIIEILSVTDNPIDLYKITNEYELLDMMEDIKTIWRRSREYKGWVVWKKNRHEQTVCKTLNIDVKNYKTIKIEQHHHPIVLEDICWIVGLRLLSELEEGQVLTSFDIVSEVMKEHMEGNVGSVSLTTTLHQAYHEGIIQLNPKDIQGNYKAFIEKYKEHIPDIVTKRIEKNTSSIN